MNVPEFTAFLGWCSLINVALLSLTSLIIFLFKAPVTTLHSQLTGLDQQTLMPLYFSYLGQYKIVILVFNIVPYAALKLMTGS